ncbi:MAG TPA: phosphatase PAP2 family protein [Actinomycetota bacterium]|jgi:tRNA A-37 threonylcarbamoyl transferase component Bud32|nr:phosphatase PAP2 family protein [Actinomycetota bacterium]
MLQGAGVRRRPSGEAPPLPRELGRSGKFWLFMAAYLVATVAGVLLFEPSRRAVEGIDAAILRGLASWRTNLLTDVMETVVLITASWAIRILRWGTILTLILVRRWRHLIVFIGALIVEGVVSYLLIEFIQRPRPFDVVILGPWQGFSMPSRQLAALAVTLIGMTYSLIPHGRVRDSAKWATACILVLAGFARLYLAIDHPTSALFGAVLGVAIGLTAFRWFTPNDIFPVTYRRGKAAHLDVGGRRGAAIVTGVRDQLGYQVLDVQPVGLAGSGGSTPLKLRVREEGTGNQRTLFAKLYAKSHVRADRWYKLGRTILYGKLEDETPFQTVRRFVEYEDHMLRLMEDMDLPVPRPYGVVEITPEREYMIVMEFFDGAVEIGEAEVDDGVIEQGLLLVREMWDDGLAHRDIKPANLMVLDGRLKLIDVFFVQVRPSPWRQAVDLANMMLVLGLRSDARRVYEHALRWFTPDEIAEAFSATRGVASPTQLRSMMKEDGRDLVTEFRALAPQREPIKIQRWSIRRILVTLGVLLVALIMVGLIISNWAVFA